MNSHSSDDHLAIVGMACRFPGAADHREYWHNLAAGVESIRFLTDEELRAHGVPQRDIDDPDYVRAVREIDDLADFDARFFGYTPREAEIRDPQSRLFLEACHAALEDGGHDVERYRGTVGVFGGMGVNEYWTRNVERNAAAMAAMGSETVEVSNGADYLATNVSHRLGLDGPSLTVQTACSTSLVAVHLAGRSLRAGDCDLALAGGVEVQLALRGGYRWVPGGIDSRDGHCRAFDTDASGTIFGTGVGVVALKRLAAALSDGDHIYAVVRGSALNNDGADRSGFTTPNMASQARVVAAALAAAGVPPESISYLEAHGTGTPVGDPIEVAALTQAFRAGGVRSRGRCRIGSAKPNVGHLGAAAGMAGLIKVCLALRHEAIPPSINFARPNPRIDFDDSPFAVNTALTPWPRTDTPRRAGISAFGVGGTNAHMVVEEPPRRESRPANGRRRQLLPVSARTVTALASATARLAEHLGRDGDHDHAGVAYTLQTGRRQFPYRRAVVASTPQEAAAALAADGTGPVEPAVPRAVAYLFPGQGAQYPGMGRGLYETEPVFREAVERCAELLTPAIGVDLRTLLFPEPGQDEAAAASLRETRFTQPALFTVEYALAETLRSWGIPPEAMIGHSIGEWVAAHLAGVFSLPDALGLVAERGRLMQSMPAGAMLAVPLPEGQLAELLGDDLEIAAVNAPEVTVVSGAVDAIDGFGGRLRTLAIPATRLHTSHAFHSRAMEPILARFGEAVAAVARSAPTIPFVSNVTGTWIKPHQAVDPAYWTRQLRAPVRFADGLRTLGEAADRLLVEVGPGDTLGRLARQTLAGADIPIVPTMRGPHRTVPDDAVLAEALGRLWVAGVSPDWERYWRPSRPRRAPLPPYPFERQRFWLDPDDRPAETGQEDDSGGVELLPIGQAVFATRWRESSLPPAGTLAIEPHWLLLSDGGPVLESLRERLVAAGARVSLAVPGKEFARSAEDRYTVRPEQPEDLGRLLASVTAADGPPTRIVHGFALTEALPDPLAPGAVAEVFDHGFYSLLHLAQEVTKHRGDHQVWLFAVSSNLQEVTGAEPLEPAKAALLGPSLLIGRELSGVRCRSIDLELPSRLTPAALAGQLFTELTAGTDAPQVAWRGRKRWVWDHETVPLDEAPGPPAALRERGVYLIAGGLGGIGLVVAQELARLVRARLVLVGRTLLPGRDEWDSVVADPGTPDRLRETLRRLQEVERAGGEVMIRACDITDEAQLSAVVDEATARFGAIHGAFHSAGVAGGGMLAVRARADAEQVLAPKVAGTLVMHRVLRGRVDFLLLFSSVTAVVGDFALVDYVAANNFQDAFARYAAARHDPVYSIGWPLWRDYGMATAVDSVPLIIRELHTGARSEPAAHPLLDRRIYDRTGDIVFSTVLRPGSHWIITDHTIGDVPVVPGSAVVEMLRAAYAEAVGGPVELRDIVFIAPIAVTEPTEVRLLLRHTGEEYDATVVASPAGTGYTAGSERVRGRIRRRDGEAPVHDLAALAGRCDRQVFDPETRPAGLVWHGEHWHSVRSIHVGDGEELARVVLDERFRPECDQYALHPGLFDDAVSNSQYLPSLAPDTAAFLPLSYGRIAVFAALPPEFTVHVRHLDKGEGDEIVSDLTLIGDDGRELVRVDRYTGRRVEPAAVLARLGPDPTPAAMSTQAGSPRRVWDWAISEPDGLDALRRILHHLPEPHLVVSPEGLAHNLERVASLTSELVARELADAQLPVGPAGDRPVSNAYAPPENEVQKLMAELLQDALGLRQVGLDDDFFELGGNSLVAVQLGFRLRERLDLEIPIALLLEQPTARAVAASLERMLAGRGSAAAVREPV